MSMCDYVDALFLGFENLESMAGWSKVTDGSALTCFKILQELHKKGFSVKCGEIDNKLRESFNLVVSEFLKEICHSSCYRPLPPMLGDGKPVDLLKLYLSVREKGGYESVSENGLWNLVARESGFGSGDSAALKLVYVKYLELLDEWFYKAVKDKNSGKGGLGFMDLKVDFERFFSDIRMTDDEGFVDMGAEKSVSDSKDVQSCIGSFEGKDCGDSVKRSVECEKDDAVFESTGAVREENESIRKRKRECCLPLLDWVKRVAKNPCDPSIGSLPERSKWKAYGSEHVWKQVLLAREAMLSKINIDSKIEQSIWQRQQKMHPAMYNDPTEKSTSRCSQRLISAKETRAVLSSGKSLFQDCSEMSSTGSLSDVEDEESFWVSNYKRKRIPLGQHFQAKVPVWTEEAYESESKWLGTPVWPLEKGESRSSLIERERIGKGRQDSCGCQFPGSVECVRFHISEKKNRVKLELGSAFSKWKFDDMGEEVSVNWTKHEEKKFADIIKSSVSLEKDFWVELSSYFKNKSRPVLASYYYNVYLVRRRAHQNRHDPSNIDSDDEELEKVGPEEVNKSTGSILCSPKKAHLSFR